MIKNISNLGDAALYCDFGSEVSKEINSLVIKYYKNIKDKKIEEINNLTPSYNKLILFLPQFSGSLNDGCAPMLTPLAFEI